MSTQAQRKNVVHGENAGVLSYVVGFVLSLVLTVAAYWAVVVHDNSGHQTISHTTLTIGIVVLAFMQLLVQLLFFLHLGRAGTARLHRNTLLFAVLIITILVVGSIWIMQNLDYSHPDPLSPEEINTYIMDEEAIQK